MYRRIRVMKGGEHECNSNGQRRIGSGRSPTLRGRGPELLPPSNQWVAGSRETSGQEQRSRPEYPSFFFENIFSSVRGTVFSVQTGLFHPA